MERVADRLLDLMLMQLLMEVLPDVLAIVVAAGEKMIDGLVLNSTGWASAHLRCRGSLMTGV